MQIKLTHTRHAGIFGSRYETYQFTMQRQEVAYRESLTGRRSDIKEMARGMWTEAPTAMNTVATSRSLKLRAKPCMAGLRHWGRAQSHSPGADRCASLVLILLCVTQCRDAWPRSHAC